jgi:hypothetical protein
LYGAVRANLPRRTGVTLNEWKLLLRLSGPRTTEKEQIEWLKNTYGLGTVQARIVVREAVAPNDRDSQLRDQFSGAKEALLPIADKVVNAAQSLGVDVRVEPADDSVPFIRRHQFAVVKASGARVDLELALPGVRATERLIPVKRSSTRTTHRITLREADEVDAEVLGYLREAYELDAKR